MKGKLLALALVQSWSAHAYAQADVGTGAGEAAAPATERADEIGADDIIVTASKREESANRVPMSITALSGDDVQALGIKDVSDLTRAVPGFQAADSGYGQPVYFLRGIGFYDTSLQSKPTVSVYMDEFPFVLSPLSLGAAFDIQRVEVLKGPQGTLYGQNSTGGAINFIAEKPTDEFHLGVDARYGRFNNWELSGFVSGPITSTLNARVAVRHEEMDPWQKGYTSTTRNGSKNFTQGRLILDWKPVDSFRTEFMVNAFHDSGETQAAQFVRAFQQTPTTPLAPGFLVYPRAPANARAADKSSEVPTGKDNDFVMASLRAEVDLTPDITLTSLSAYSRFTESYGLELDGTTLAIFHALVDGKVEAFTQELRLAGTIADRAHWVVGLNYEHDDVNETQIGYGKDASSVHAFERFGVGIIDRSPSVARTRFESKAIFGNLDYEISDTLTAHAGLRYTDTKTDFAGCLRSAGTGALGYGLSIIFGINPRIEPGQCATLQNRVPGIVERTLDEDNLSWRAGLDWKPGADTLLYVNVSRGYKSGGFPNLGATDAAQYTPVRQEEVTAYEAGFKIGIPDARIQLNGAGFYYDYADKQLKGRLVVPIFGALNAIVNVPKSRVVGAELQASWRPVRGLRMSAGATWLDTKVEGTFLNYTWDGVLTDFDGASFPYTPKWQVNADAEYEWDLSGDLEAFVGANASYRSATNSQFIPVDLFRIDPYTLIDARAGIKTRDGKWRLTVSGQNITNKYYWTQSIRTGDAITRYTGMPATWSVAVSYRY